MPLLSHPTAEQVRALDLFSTGGSLKINAFAGTGKTTTLEYLASHSRAQGIYLAFNKSIADNAAGRFPSNVRCQTTHSLAYRSTPSMYRNDRSKMTHDLNPNAIAVILNLDDLVISSYFSLGARSRGALVRQTLKHFQHSDAVDLCANHVPRWGKLAALSKPELETLIADTTRLARTLWQRMLDPSERAPLGHDGYFKRWSLNDPEIPGNFILLDEAQDTNPAMLAALRNQEAQVVYVGDRYQQIYEWRGAVNAMERVATKHECSLTQSFRFGTAIADAASLLLRALGERKRLTGTPNTPSKLGCAHPNAILCRTNAGVIDHVIQAFAADLTPHVIGGTSEALRLLDGVSRLKIGQPTDVPEFFGFQNWQEVVQFSESEEGQHLRTFVRLAERHGENKLRAYLSQVEQREDAASLVISTAHKAKGREWDNVCVVDDFTVVKKDDKGQEIGFDEEELRLLYVALTRGRLSVQIPTALASKFGIQQDYQPLRLDRLSLRRGAYSNRSKHRPMLQQTKQATSQYSKYNNSERLPRSEPSAAESALRRFLKRLLG
jgi:hypothetical protein